MKREKEYSELNRKLFNGGSVAGKVMTFPDVIIAHRLKRVIAGLAMCLLTACASHSEVPVKTVYQSHQCAVDESKLIFLDSLEQVYAFIESTKRFQLGADQEALIPPLAEGRVVAVTWGNRPTGGYRLELNGEVASIANETLNLPVNFVSPEVGQINTQVITSPCIVISIAAEDGYQWVEAGELRMAVPYQHAK